MNQSLTALMTRLTWQSNELCAHLEATENESNLLIQQIQELEQKIEQSSSSPIIINPELEINKLNFITQQHEKKNELLMTLKNHQALESKLKDKLLRVKTELKMLEKYMEREDKAQKEQQMKAQENALEEWVLQKRESA